METIGQKFTSSHPNYRGLKTIDGVLMSWCSTHKAWEPTSLFSKSRNRKCGFQYDCKEAQANLKKQYKILIPEGTLCAFENCSKLATCRDHDHITGKFRDFLCHKHNGMLGHADDTLQDLLDGIKYLTTYNEIIN